jgi:hypothetical protein
MEVSFFPAPDRFGSFVWFAMGGFGAPGCRSDVGFASNGDSTLADAPSALVLEGLVLDFATTSGDGIFNFAFVFHIDQET